MKKSILFIVAALLILTQACIRDMGNYDYLDINEFQFVGFQTPDGVDATIGRSPANPINVEDPLQGITLIPVISTSMDTEENLVFAWLNDSAGVPLTVHQGRNLENFRVPAHWSGNTVVTLRIRDVVSRKILNTPININVVNPFTAGYMVLQVDNQGYMRLDMLSWLHGVEYRHMKNVLEGSGFPRQRGARQVVSAPDGIGAAAFGGRSVFIITDDPDVYRVDHRDFTWVGEQGHLRNAFLSAAFFPAELNVTNMSNLGLTPNLLNMEGNLFFHNPPSQRFFSFEQNRRADGSRFPASRHVSQFAATFLIFDDESKSFYMLRPNTDVTWSVPVVARPDSLTSLRNMGMDLIFSGAASSFIPASPPPATSVPSNTMSYNILRDASGNYHALRIIMETGQQEYFRPMNMAGLPEGAATNLDNAIMAVGGEFVESQMYVAIGGRVFQYNIRTNLFTEVLHLPGETITFMGFLPNARHVGPTDHPDHGRDAHRFIVIGSFDGTMGTLTHFRIPSGTGRFTVYQDENTGQIHQWDGFGEIRDVINR